MSSTWEKPAPNSYDNFVPVIRSSDKQCNKMRRGVCVFMCVCLIACHPSAVCLQSLKYKKNPETLQASMSCLQPSWGTDKLIFPRLVMVIGAKGVNERGGGGGGEEREGGGGP